MAFLEVIRLTKKYEEKEVVSSLNFNLPQYQKLAITGETGSGKSSLMKMIAGLLQPDQGNVFFEGNRVIGPLEQLLPGHPGIAYLSQDSELRNNYRVEELLEYANKLPVTESEQLFRLCRIDHLLKRKNNEISGGEKQRIALTRLLIGSPKLLLLDEPFSNLDLIHKKILKEVLGQISSTLGITCIITSHDPMDTLSWADEIKVLQKGKIIQQDTPEKIYRYPVTEYVAGLFGAYNLFGPEEAAWPGGKQLHWLGDDQWLCRPEQIVLQQYNREQPAATVKNIRFSGSFYEWKLEMNGKSILARTMGKDFEVNDRVSISIRQSYF
jgi:iron(III) transport system ATP-binding protein